MSSRSRSIALGMALLVTVPACGSSDDAEGAPAASTTEVTTTTAAASVSFESTRYPYRVVMPADWTLSQIDGTWTSLDQFSAGEQVPGEEVLGTPDRDTFLVVNSMALPDGTTPAAWTDAFGTLVAEGLFDGCTRTTGDGTVAGEPADVVEDTCGDDLIVGRSLVHGGRGWYFTTRGTDEDTAVLDDLVASIEFTDD
jgi:hypothetical protein